MTDEHDTKELVEETRTGYRLMVESTRGTGTRDEDTVKAELRTETIEELEQKRPQLLKDVYDAMEDRRRHQPDEEDDE